MSVWSLYVIESDSLALNDAQSRYFNGIGLLDHALTLFGMGLSAAAAITLFTLNKAAVNLFLAGLVFTILNMAYAAIATPWLAAVGAAGAIGSVVGFGISVVIYLYARSLHKREILT